MDPKPSHMNLSRRAAMSVLGGGLFAAGNIEAATRHSKMSAKILDVWPFAVQLWAVNAQLQTDVPGTLKRLKSIGYDYVETAGLAGKTPQEFRKMLDDNGLTCRSAHAPMSDLISMLDQRIEEARAVGAVWLVCASPKTSMPVNSMETFVAAMKGITLDGWKENAGYLAEIAPKVKAAGLKLAYHNHFGEFADHDGVTGYETLVAAASPESLRLEVDLGWVAVSGLDPIDVLRKYADRVDLLHVKDMTKDAAQILGYRSVEVGQGIIQWGPLLKEAKRLGVKYAVVEQEPPFVRDIFESLSMSRTYLKGL
jgi:sugar phosphate isomerase/epimerase